MLRIAGFAVLRLTLKHLPLVAHRGAGQVWAEGLFEPGVVARLGDQGAGQGLECRQDFWGSYSAGAVRAARSCWPARGSGRGRIARFPRRTWMRVPAFAAAARGRLSVCRIAARRDGRRISCQVLGESGEVRGLGEPCFGLQGGVAAKGDCGGAGRVRAHGDVPPMIKLWPKVLPQGECFGPRGGASPSFPPLAMQRH
jgi:hypothetical protein